MASLTESTIATLLQPYLVHQTSLPVTVYPQLSVYLEILLKWNARTNLTAIREPEEIVRRHFGESIFVAQYLDPSTTTLLDFGSGAGFPGLPIAILCPQVQVTLAESQNKKATFLREVVRNLNLSVEVWAARVETMPETRVFHTVTLRAVDNMAAALVAAGPRASSDLLLLTNGAATLPSEFSANPVIRIPTTQAGVLLRATRL